MLLTMSVPQKGENAYAVDRVCKFLDSLGYKRIRARCDQEASIRALRSAIKDCWSGELVPDDSPVGEHQSNGSVEAGIRTAQAQIRALKNAVRGQVRY